MKTYLQYGLFAILALCILLPIAYSCDWSQYATMATTMLSGLCGLMTLYIMILLYDRYGVEAKTREQVLNAVNQTIEEFKKVTFILCSYPEAKDGEIPSDYIITLTFQSTKDNVTNIITEEALSSLLYYKDSGMYGCAQLVQNTLQSVYLPKPIALAIKKLYILKYEKCDLEKEERPITTLSAFSNTTSADKDKLDATDTRIPENQFSVIQFIDAYFGVKDAIVKWYKENNIDVERLNLDYASK